MRTSAIIFNETQAAWSLEVESFRIWMFNCVLVKEFLHLDAERYWVNTIDFLQISNGISLDMSLLFTDPSDHIAQ